MGYHEKLYMRFIVQLDCGILSWMQPCYTKDKNSTYKLIGMHYDKNKPFVIHLAFFIWLVSFGNTFIFLRDA